MSDTGPKLTVITPEAVGCYAWLNKPQPAMTPGGEPSYSLTLVFPKSVDLRALKDAARAAADRKWPNKKPPKLRSPFRDGDEDKPDDPTFANSIFITARTKQKPGVVGRDNQPLPDPDFDIYSGMICRASVTAFGYDQAGNVGVSFILNNVQKTRNGTRLSGRKPAEQEFASAPPLEDDDEAEATPSKGKKDDSALFD